MWLHIPFGSFPSSPASEDSTSESRSPSPELALWVTLSGNPTQRPLSWRGWKTRPWIRLLSGTTSPASMAARGVASWIASLAASPARTSPPPAGRKASGKATAPASGSSSDGSLAKWDPGTFSWRTSQLLLFEDSTSCLERLPTSGSMRNGSLWARETLAPRTSAIGFSSWPTARAEDSESCGNHSGPNTHKGDSLTGVTKDWRTPNTRDHHMQGPREGHEQRQETLVDQIQAWPTPRTISGGAESAERKKELGRLDAGGGDLQAAVEKWTTPKSRDWKGGQGAVERHEPDLDKQAEKFPVGPPEEKPGQSGPTSSTPARTSRRRLNPAFVCWLMGWPWWWTRAERISFAALETESWLCRQRWLLRSLFGG